MQLNQNLSALKTTILTFVLAAAALSASAEAPAGYYQSCEGKGGKSLLEQLCKVISDHENVGYSGLWTMYQETDTREDGTIWDMYSTKRWTYKKEQCGSYSAVGDCYNREHSMPKSWFNDASPMYSDGFHIYPTDGKVNGLRGNLPYGECASGSTPSAPNGIKALGRIGSCTFSGYSGRVFEPDDEYKGDFARSYFYMAACYNDRIANWDSDMLAGNSYPAFKTWAVDLLLKWHRQDPVSAKEIDRNDAVYGYQHNRNPFIDHPELAEYVWGDKASERWTANGEPTLTIVGGETIDMGMVAVGVAASKALRIKGTNLTADVKVACQGQGFSVSPTTIAMAKANEADGATVTVTLTAQTGGEYAATLTVSSGALQRTVAVKATAVDGIPANEPRYVTAESAMASWTYVGDGSTYTLTLTGAGQTVNYTVNAAAGEYLIEDLEPETQYAYTLASANLKSNTVTFTTGTPIPFIELASAPYPESVPGEPSDAYEIELVIDNIDVPVALSIDAPFEISADKAEWAHAITIDPEQDRIYVRINSATAGKFGKLLLAEAGDYLNDEMYIYGEVADRHQFIEDFEADAEGCDTYNGCDYIGSAATWHLANAGIWKGDTPVRSGKQCVRMGKNANSSITMTTDKDHGIGTVKVHAAQWTSGEGNCTFALEYSADKGQTWERIGTADVTSPAYQEFTFTVNKPGTGRVRVQQTVGKRFMVDDIEISDNTASIEAVEGAAWDAYFRAGRLVIETAEPMRVRIYGVDGIIWHDDLVPAGVTAFEPAPGLYIVSNGAESRRVVVK